jgi:hypothetical protein
MKTPQFSCRNSNAVVLVVLLGMSGSAIAGITTSGDATSTANAPTADYIVGATADGTLTVDNGSSFTPVDVTQQSKEGKDQQPRRHQGARP